MFHRTIIFPDPQQFPSQCIAVVHIGRTTETKFARYQRCAAVCLRFHKLIIRNPERVNPGARIVNENVSDYLMLVFGISGVVECLADENLDRPFLDIVVGLEIRNKRLHLCRRALQRVGSNTITREQR